MSAGRKAWGGQLSTTLPPAQRQGEGTQTAVWQCQPSSHDRARHWGLPGMGAGPWHARHTAANGTLSPGSASSTMTLSNHIPRGLPDQRAQSIPRQLDSASALPWDPTPAGPQPTLQRPPAAAPCIPHSSSHRTSPALAHTCSAAGSALAGSGLARLTPRHGHSPRRRALARSLLTLAALPSWEHCHAALKGELPVLLPERARPSEQSQVGRVPDVRPGQAANTAELPGPFSSAAPAPSSL